MTKLGNVLLSLILKETRNSYFCLTPKNRRFMSIHHVSSNNSKNANRRHISLTGTDHCISQLSKDIQFEYGLRKTTIQSSFKSKGRILERFRISLYSRPIRITSN